MNDLRIRDILKTQPQGRSMTVEGWVRTRRDSKEFSFLELNDGSGLSSLQVLLSGELISKTPDFSKITTGASISVTGTLVESPGKNQAVELHADSVRLIGDSPADAYPLQKKRHSFEFLREIAHLRARTNTFGAVARVRSAMSYAIHTYFQEHGFVYVHTPVITASDCEGAGAMFQVTTLDVANPPRTEAGEIDYDKDFFGKRANLTVSGQLEGETYATALGRIYTFGPTFRAENSNTTRHLAEFWMVEPEMSFCDITGNMDVAEEFLKYILNYVLTQCAEDMKFFNDRIQPGILDSLMQVVSSSFTRITYTEAVERIVKSGVKFEFPVRWGDDLQSEHEKYLTEQVYKGPVIVTGYPREIKSFYMKLNEDGRTVRGMDVLVPRLGEIIGGSEREENLSVLEARMKELGLPHENYWWYLDLRRFGSVPHSGFGLGFERLIQYVTGMQNIRDVIPYPRAVRSADF